MAAWLLVHLSAEAAASQRLVRGCQAKAQTKERHTAERFDLLTSDLHGCSAMSSGRAPVESAADTASHLGSSVT